MANIRSVAAQKIVWYPDNFFKIVTILPRNIYWQKCTCLILRNCLNDKSWSLHLAAWKDHSMLYNPDFLTNQNGRWEMGRFYLLIPCSTLKLENVIAHTRFSISIKLPKGSLSSTLYNHVLDWTNSRKEMCFISMLRWNI
jgi:hypothetical protein